MKSIFKDLENYDDNTALFIGQTRISYQELQSTADELASQVKKRCLVLIACNNSFSSLAGYVCFLRAGIVPLLVSNIIDKICYQGLDIRFAGEHFGKLFGMGIYFATNSSKSNIYTTKSENGIKNTIFVCINNIFYLF